MNRLLVSYTTATSPTRDVGQLARASLICDNMEESQMSMMDGPSVTLASARRTAANHHLLRAMRVLPSAVEHHSESLYAYKVLEAIGGCVRLTNATRPRCGTEVTRATASGWKPAAMWMYGRQLQPAVPGTTDRLVCRLGVGPEGQILPAQVPRALSFLPSHLEPLDTDDRKPEKTLKHA
ncbi:unnamed protein product [Boreogadus saida]